MSKSGSSTGADAPVHMQSDQRRLKKSGALTIGLREERS
jgi:hypothetical protein